MRRPLARAGRAAILPVPAETAEDVALRGSPARSRVVPVRRSSFLVPRSSFLVPRSSFLVPRSSFLVPRSSFVVRRSSFVPGLSLRANPSAPERRATRALARACGRIAGRPQRQRGRPVRPISTRWRPRDHHVSLSDPEPRSISRPIWGIRPETSSPSPNPNVHAQRQNHGRDRALAATRRIGDAPRDECIDRCRRGRTEQASRLARMATTSSIIRWAMAFRWVQRMLRCRRKPVR